MTDSTILYTALFTALTAFATVLIAFFTWNYVKTANNATNLSAIAKLMTNMGSFPDIGILRGRLRNDLAIRDKKNNNLTGIKKLANLSNPDKTKSDVSALTASFDRACATMIMTLNKDQVFQVIDLFGDVFLDYWAYCFEILRDHQRDRNDDDNRMFYEYITYISYSIFCSQGRNFQTQNFYSTLGIEEYMASRLPILEKRKSLKKFAAKMKKGDVMIN